MKTNLPVRLLAFLGAAWGLLPGGISAEQPNFLLFMADDLTYHDLGLAGNPDVKTPHLDQFATEGTLFTHAYSSAPTCAPTRMSLYTGLHPVRHGGHPNHSEVYPDVITLPHHLQELGYRVALMGKRHEKPVEQFPWEFLGGLHHDDGTKRDLDLTLATQFLEEVESQPWCLIVTSNQPHTPWNLGDPSAYPPDKLSLPPNFPDTPTTREWLGRYYAEITYLDYQFGDIMRQLEASGEADNTVVVFLTEQGSNFPFAKWTCYEQGVRATKIVRWPDRIAAGQSRDDLVQYVDIVPTFIELAGGMVNSADFDGVSLAELWQNPAAVSPHDYVFSMATTRGIYHGSEAYGIRSVSDGTFRLIWNLHHETAFQNTVTRNFPPYRSWARAANADPFAAQQFQAYQHRPEFELYETRIDPLCQNNLAGDITLAPQQTRLLDALKTWMAQQGDQGDATERAAFERMPSKRSSASP